MPIQRLIKRLGWIGLGMAISGLAWLVAPLRLEDPRVHQMVSYSVVWVVLLSSSVAAALLPPRIWMGVALAMPIGLLAVAYPATLFLSMIGGGPLSDYQAISRVEFADSSVVAYKINGGATVDYRIRVYHLKPLLPGVVLARELHDAYHEYEASLVIRGADVVQARFRGGLPWTEYQEQYRLRPNVVF